MSESDSGISPEAWTAYYHWIEGEGANLDRDLAFVTGWHTRDEQVARLRADLGTALAIIVVPPAYPDRSPSLREETKPRLQIAITEQQREWAISRGGEYNVKVSEIRRAEEGRP